MPIFGGYPHGSTSELVCMVGISTMLQQHLHNVHMSFLGCDAEGCGPLVACVVDHSSMFDQKLDHSDMALPGRRLQG